MASKIKIKRSAVAGKVPLTTDLELSELAVNTNDGRLYTKKDNGTESIVEIGGPDFGSRDVTTTGTSTAASFTPTSSTVPTNGVYLPAANSVALSTNGVQRINIEADGDINIDSGGVFYDATNNRLAVGTQSPGFALQTQITGTVDGNRFSTNNRIAYFNTSLEAGNQYGQIAIKGFQGSGITFLRGSTGSETSSAGIFTDVNDNLLFTTGGAAERLRITSAGLVGIGTGLPSERLHLIGSTSGASSGAAYNVLRLVGNGTSPTNAGGLTFGAYWNNVDVNGRTAYIQSSQGLNAGSTARALLLNPSGGNVGIGTTSPGATLDVFTGSNRYVRFSTNGDTSLIRTTESGGANRGFSVAGEYIKFDTGTSAGSTINEAARIDSSGRLLVGTSSARTNLYGASYAPVVQIETAGTLQQRTLNLAFNNGGATGSGPILSFVTSRGSTTGSNTLVANNDELGALGFAGADGTKPVTGANIVAYVDGTPGTNDMPGRLVFSTTADGASSPTEQLRITSDRYVRLASGSGGIQFNGDTAAANALDDYEEGTFSPNWSFAGGGSVNLNQFSGIYTKIGNIVHFGLLIVTSSISSPSGNATITGLPFSGTSSLNGVSIGYWRAWGSDMPNLKGYVSGTSIILHKSASNIETPVALQGSDFSSFAVRNNLIIGGSYRTA